MPQNVQNRNGYFLGSWCVACVRYSGELPVRSGVALPAGVDKLFRLSRERGSFTGRMSCAPWQS